MNQGCGTRQRERERERREREVGVRGEGEGCGKWRSAHHVGTVSSVLARPLQLLSVYCRCLRAVGDVVEPQPAAAADNGPRHDSSVQTKCELKTGGTRFFAFFFTNFMYSYREVLVSLFASGSVSLRF